MIFNRMDYWRNVLSYNKTRLSCLILEDISDEELEFIEDSFWVDYIYYPTATPLYNIRNLYLKGGELSFTPQELKNLNYALYRGDNKEILAPLMASGITIIKDIKQSLNEQTSIERVNNFDNLTQL